MSIAVICPGCKKSFRVSEKFAGKKGPCPNCKVVITIPEAAVAEVKIHEEETPATKRDSKGQLVTKPIKRTDKKVTPLGVIIVAGVTLLLLAGAWMLRDALQGNDMVRAAATLLVSPLFVFSGYASLRDDELAPHRGKSLWVRMAICSVVYAGLWMAFHFVPSAYTQEAWHWLFLTPPFVIAGAVAALACFDVEFSIGIMHYCFYLLSTLALAFVAKIGPFLAEASDALPT